MESIAGEKFKGLPFVVADFDDVRIGNNNFRPRLLKLFFMFGQHQQVHVKQRDKEINSIPFTVFQEKRNIARIIDQRGNNRLVCILKCNRDPV